MGRGDRLSAAAADRLCVQLFVRPGTYHEATGRQIWQTAKGDTKPDAKAERAELLAQHRGERVERTTLTVSEVAQVWLERGTRPRGSWSPTTRERCRHVGEHFPRHDPARRDQITAPPTNSRSTRSPTRLRVDCSSPAV
ncbi:MAG: hypothetical protein M3P18_07190 [Actinomycetota bacterium]|nr:hypothetical protein [Actinomycetota bacterium]